MHACRSTLEDPTGLLAALFVALAALRVLLARWRSAPVVERLGADLRQALVAMFVGLGVFGLLGQTTAALMGPGLHFRLEVFRLAVVVATALIGSTIVGIALARPSRE